jgi:radical SAM protein with 4Fe4S-binding SPASM domain
VSKAALYWRLFRGVVENPRFYYFVLKGSAWEKTARRLARAELPAHGEFHPVKLDLRLVYACNLRCKMCGQWGETGTYFDYDRAKLAQVLSRDVIERVVRELVPHGLRYVDMEGGETFLHPEIMDLLRSLKSQGLFVKPVTNGTRLERFAREIVDARIDAIHVSVDGDRDTHNSVRGFDWAYDKTLDGLRALTEERRSAGRHTPLVQVSYTMTRHNGPDALKRLCDDLAGQGLVDVISIKASPIWLPREKGEAYQRLVDRYLGVSDGVTSWEGFVEDYRDFGDEARGVAEAIRGLKASDYDFFVSALPNIDLEQLPRMYTDYEWNLGRTHCSIPYLEPTIEADGNVYPCNLYTDEPMSMGNVHEQPFLDIWFGAKYQAFRKMLHEEGGLLPICNRCCQLTES